MDFIALPNDIFYIIVSYLDPKDCICCRRVDTKWRKVFVDNELNRHLLIQHFPRAREVRRLLTDAPNLTKLSEIEDETRIINDGHDWADVLGKVAARYYYLRTGRPRGIETLALALGNSQRSNWSSHVLIEPWQRYVRYKENISVFNYSDSLWTFENGILIFPSAERQKFALYDLETSTFSDIKFDPTGKIVRRMRLAERVLVVEWCEHDSCHNPSGNKTVYRHFSTVYDIIPAAHKGKWQTVFRNEIKIDVLGLSVDSTDRIFSTHSSTTYVTYFWQVENFTQTDPFESIVIWDISHASPYRPSLDLAGNSSHDAPPILRRLSLSDLNFYSIRQGRSPCIRELRIDANHIYVVSEDYHWLVGQQASPTHSRPRLHSVSCIGIPFFIGPRSQHECGVDIQRPHCLMVSTRYGPGSAPCWRHKNFPYLNVSEVADNSAGVRFYARSSSILQSISESMRSRICVQTPMDKWESRLPEQMWKQLMTKGHIAGDERWLVGENEKEIVILRFERD